MQHTDAIVARIKRELGEPEAWTGWPGGWPDEISTALIDAVFSARAQYSTRRGKGVHALVLAWREANPAQVDSLSELVAAVEAKGPQAWGRDFGNEQHSPGRGRSLPDDPWKAAAVRDAAKELVAIGVETSDGARAEAEARISAALRRVAGIGKATTSYFLMLLGTDGVKPDVMINRFLHDATGAALSHDQAVNEISAAAERLRGSTRSSRDSGSGSVAGKAGGAR